MPERPKDAQSTQEVLDGYITAAAADPAATVSQIKAQALAIIQLITLSPKPSYKIKGREIRHSDYLKSLRETVTWADQSESELSTEGPYQLDTEAFG